MIHAIRTRGEGRAGANRQEEARAGQEDQAPPCQPGTRWAMLLCDGTVSGTAMMGPLPLASLGSLPARACVRTYALAARTYHKKPQVTAATRACRAAHCTSQRRRLGPDGSIRAGREGSSSFACAVRWTRLRDCSIGRHVQALSAPWSCVVHTMLYIRAKSRNTVSMSVSVSASASVSATV